MRGKIQLPFVEKSTNKQSCVDITCARHVSLLCITCLNLVACKSNVLDSIYFRFPNRNKFTMAVCTGTPLIIRDKEMQQIVRTILDYNFQPLFLQ